MVSRGPNSFPKVAVRLTERERLLLLESFIIPEDLTRPLRFAVVRSDEFEVGYTLEDLGHLAGYVAAEANHADSQELERVWDALYDKIVTAGDAFVDSLPEDARAADYMSDEACERNRSEVEEFLDSLPVPLAEEVYAILERGEFQSREELEEQIAEAVSAFGTRQLPSLGGLTPIQMNALMESDWTSAGPGVRLNQDFRFEDVAGARIFHNARVFLPALRDSGGTKVTGAGNLNRKFVGEMLDRMRFEEWYVDMIRQACKVINEEDVQRLHILRVVLRQAGFIRKYRGKFLITKNGNSCLGEDDDSAGRLYLALFDTLFREINLAYIDQGPDLVGIQGTLPYIFYRLREAARDWRPAGDLAEEVLLEPIQEEVRGLSPFGDLDWPFSKRVLDPLVEFGLLDSRRVPRESLILGETEYRKTEWYDRFLRFELGE